MMARKKVWIEKGTDHDPKYTMVCWRWQCYGKEFVEANEWDILNWPSQSCDLNPLQHVLHLQKTEGRKNEKTGSS